MPKAEAEPFPTASGCQRCGTSLLLLVDGQEMSEQQLLELRRAPRNIARRIVHSLWCDSLDHRMQLTGRAGRSS